MTAQEIAAYNALPESLRKQIIQAADLVYEAAVAAPKPTPEPPSPEEAQRLREYFPFRHIWADWTEADGWVWHATTTRRALLKAARTGRPLVEAH